MSSHPFRSSLLVSLSLVLCSPFVVAQESAADEEARRYGTIGALTGAAVGAVVGGPPGAVVTAAFGGWLSDRMLVGRQNRMLRAELENAHAELVALQESHVELQQQQARVVAQQNRPQLAALASAEAAGVRITPGGLNPDAANSEVVLHFRSNSAVVEPHYKAELQSFMNTVQATANPVVEVLGYADRRGTGSANLALSQQRVQAVEKQLRGMGMRAVIVETTALGSNDPLTQAESLESNFFDRRVVLRVRSEQSALLSNNP